MHKIKRYANRKLYNTTNKRYITLDEIADLVQGGDEVEVIENESGEDITNITLSQIIFEKQKKRDAFVPRSIFHDLIQNSGNTLYDTLQKLMQGGLGMALTVEKEAEKMLRKFVKSGDITEDEGRKLSDQLKGQADKTRNWITARIDERVEQILQRLGVVTQTELRELLTLLEEVKSKLAAVEAGKQD